MPKNFDDLISQERTFVVRGETFTWRDVRPEILTAFQPVEQETKEGEEADNSGIWKQLDEQIQLFLVPEDVERWANLRSREDNPVTIVQLNAILEWLVGEQTERPTQTPSPSGTGRGKTGRSLQAA
jgi:hypothetical protein